MSLKLMQKQVDEQIMDYGGYWRPFSMLLRFFEEIGEFSRAINIKYGDKKAKSTAEGRDIASELVDILFTVLAIAKLHKIDAQACFLKDLEKKNIFLDPLNTEFGDIKQALIANKIVGTKEVCLLLKTIDLFLGLAPLVKNIKEINETEQLILEDNPLDEEPIANIIYIILDFAIDLEIDLMVEFNKKYNADMKKMEKVYKG